MGESQGNIKPFSHGAETDPSLLNNNLRNYEQIRVICGHILGNMPNQGLKTCVFVTNLDCGSKECTQRIGFFCVAKRNRRRLFFGNSELTRSAARRGRTRRTTTVNGVNRVS